MALAKRFFGSHQGCVATFLLGHSPAKPGEAVVALSARNHARISNPQTLSPGFLF